MARTNYSATAPRTHQGGAGVAFSPADQLQRAVMCCLLWERNFYESGVSIVERIKGLVADVDPQITASLARKARNEFKLRHVPLLLARELLRNKAATHVDHLIYDVIQRADEPAELLAMYWADQKDAPLSAALKRGLARAVTKFDRYQVAKWQGGDKAVKFRDVLFLTHAKPLSNEQADIWKHLVDGTLPSPDTWEVALSAGADKKETFTRLLQERKLGYMALLRNLRNMEAAGVDKTLVHEALVSGAAKSRALPFRYLSAARAVPAWEAMVDEAMMLSLAQQPPLTGKTALLVDVSGSMGYALAQGDLKRIDAAKALAILLRGVCTDVDIFTFNNALTRVPARSGMALADAIGVPKGGTYLGQALKGLPYGYDRTIVITDEQSADSVGAPQGKGYMLDVAGHQNGVGYGQWTRVSGFSEAIVSYIAAAEGREIPAGSVDD